MCMYRYSILCLIFVVEKMMDIFNTAFSPGSSLAQDSPVQDLLALGINSTTFDISFIAPSSSNGTIDHYEIEVSNTLDMPSNFTITVDNNNNTTDQFVVTTNGLCE